MRLIRSLANQDADQGVPLKQKMHTKTHGIISEKGEQWYSERTLHFVKKGVHLTKINLIF